jgi:molybdopterin molybdotransferase
MSTPTGTARTPARSLDEALAEIWMRCSPLPAERVPLGKALGRVLRESIHAPEDAPTFDRSAVDGYAIRRDEAWKDLRVVDNVRAGEWKPRILQPGEAVQIATGAALPCDGLQVVMLEDTQRDGSFVHLVSPRTDLNVRFRGEAMREGQLILPVGSRLHPGALALLASIGHVQPLVSPRLAVLHLTTGDEIVPPDVVPMRGQIRDCNSTLIGSLLHSWPCVVAHQHLPEAFETAWSALDHASIAGIDLLLISGGSGIGERDFTRSLLERLGYDIVFAQIKARPGKPTIMAVNGHRIAFGLPGNPLAHFVCFHLEVVTALARLLGTGSTPEFLRGRLATELRDDACPRETLHPARLEWSGTAPRLRPLRWNNSGDINCLAEADAILRFPANCEVIPADGEVQFLPLVALAASRSS